MSQLVMKRSRTRPLRISVRLLWPFVRVLGAGPEVFDLLSRVGVGLAAFADPETRVAFDTAMKLLGLAVARSNDPAMGVRAAEAMEPGDFDPLDAAARRCGTLGEATTCVARYFCLMNEAAVVALEERGADAMLSYTPRPGAEHHPAANDFVMAFAVLFARRYAGVTAPSKAVHLAHAAPTDALAYERVFGGAEVVLGMPRNAIVFPRAWLQRPMANADPALQDGFERLAPDLARRYRRDVTSVRIRDLFREGALDPSRSMSLVARRLGMSAPTLRRRLNEEGSTLSQLLDDERKALAFRYLAEGRTLGEVAFLLGYGSERSFRRVLAAWERRGTADGHKPGRRRPTVTH